MEKKWIGKAIQHPGALHRQLGIPHGEKIPKEALMRALRGEYGPLAAKRARLAKTLKKISR